MAAPAFTAQDERIAAVLMAMETAPAARIHAVPLVVLSQDAPPRPVLGLHAGDQHWALTPDDAMITARALNAEQPYAGARALAAGLVAGVTLTDLLLLRSDMMALRHRYGGRA